MRASLTILAGAAALGGLSPGFLEAQSWRTIQRSAAARGAEQLAVQVTYASGKLDIRPGRPGSLYSYTLRYDEEQFAPSVSYDAASSRLELSIERVEGRIRLDPGEAGDLSLLLPPDLPLALGLELGAAQGLVELGGLTLAALDVSVGAAEAEISFSEPLRQSPTIARFGVGAAELTLSGLGNLSAPELEVQAGVGRTVIDFSGALSTDVALELALGLGEVELRVPEEVAVDLRNTGLLLQVDAPGLEREGGRWRSGNVGSAAHTVTVTVEGAVGRIRVVRTGG